MDVETIFEELAAGVTGPVDLSWTRRKLQLMALERAKSGTPEQRLGSLRVATVLGRKDGLPIVQELVRDLDVRVRRAAFRLAVEAQEHGVPALRDAAGGPDPELAAEALDHLILWVDGAAIPTCRRCLAHPDPRVRERAARLLGHIAAPSGRLELERLRADPFPEVREAAAEALERLAGRVPRAVRTSWWTVDGELRAPAGPTEAPHPPGPVRDVPTWGPDATPLVPTAGAEASLPRRQLVPTTDVADEAPPTWDGHVAHLPATLPNETRALCRLLGMVGAEDRPTVLAALSDAATRASEWSHLLQAGAERDPALARGLCWAAAVHGRPGHLTPIRKLVKDPHPGVREAATAAVGALASASAFPWLAPQLEDPDSAVRVAAVAAVAALGRRTGRADLARNALARWKDDPVLRDAIALALADR